MPRLPLLLASLRRALSRPPPTPFLPSRSPSVLPRLVPALLSSPCPCSLPAHSPPPRRSRLYSRLSLLRRSSLLRPTLVFGPPSLSASLRAPFRPPSGCASLPPPPLPVLFANSPHPPPLLRPASSSLLPSRSSRLWPPPDSPCYPFSRQLAALCPGRAPPVPGPAGTLCRSPSRLSSRPLGSPSSCRPWLQPVNRSVVEKLIKILERHIGKLAIENNRDI